MLNGDGDKSFVDDLVASRYCKCESSLCCYEALRFILCFYDLFFLVLKEVGDERNVPKLVVLHDRGIKLSAHLLLVIEIFSVGVLGRIGTL